MKIKRIVSGLAALAIVFGTAAVPGTGISFDLTPKTNIVASAATEGLYEYEAYDDGTVAITRYNGSESIVSIPQILGGKIVVSIGPDSFSGNSFITTLTFPESITNIGEGAFNGCINLSSLTLPPNVQYIGTDAFSFDKSLKSVIFPDTVVSIGYCAFSNCENLSTVQLPANIDFIGDEAFSNTAITSIFIPKSLNSCGKYSGAFSGTKLRLVTFEKGITKIPDNLFRNCKSLKTIFIPDTVTAIGDYAFVDCSGLSDISWSSNIESIGVGAFKNCTSLRSSMPDTITSIGEKAFQSCTLMKVALPKNLQTLGGLAFADTFVSSIVIPSSLSECSGLGGGAFKDTMLENVTFEKGTTKIADNLFLDCYSLEKIEIPDTVTDIGDRAFENCSALRNVAMPSNLVFIGNKAFYHCTSIKKINLPDTINYLGEYAFCECYSLPEINIPEALTDLYEGTFYDCRSLKSVAIPDAVVNIPSGCFEYCLALEDVTFGNSVENIGGYAFHGCSSLTEIVIPDTVNTIGDCAFDGCSSLSKVVIPDSIYWLPSCVFNDCESLTDVTIGRNVQGFSNEAFRYNYDLKTVLIPSSVKEIWNAAFGENTSLTDVYIGTGTTYIADDVFSYPKKMTIHGVAGTYAEEFANDNNIKFEAISEDVWITKQPVSATASAEGGKVTFTVAAKADFGDPTYRWYYRDSENSGWTRTTNTTDTFSIAVSASRKGRQMYCEVMDIFGNKVDSNIVTMSYGDGVKITKQPQSVTVTSAGAVATFNVTATGTGLKYAWYYSDDGSNWKKTSVTTSSYSIAVTAARNGRQMYCIVTDSAGNTAKSNTVKMTLNAASVKITAQPVSVQVASAGAKATFNVTAVGSGLSYAWYYSDDGSNWKKTSVATNSYSIEVTSARDGRQMYCQISDSLGNSVKSNTVTMSIAAQEPVKITKQPASVTVSSAGTKATFSVTASGTGLSYAWYYSDDGSTWKKTSVTTSSYSIEVTAARNGRQMYCLVTDSAGNTAKSNVVKMSISSAVKITKQPVDSYVNIGEKATFSLTASGTGLTYAWYYSDDGSAWKKTSVTSSAYSLELTDSRNGRQMYCLVSDSQGNSVKSNIVTMKKSDSLKIVTQPDNVVVAKAGDMAAFTVGATGSGLKYAWYYFDTSSATWKKTSVTTNTYSIAVTAARDGRMMYCEITDGAGNSVSTYIVTMRIK